MAIVLTNNAQFKPYTFDEMLKPLAMVTQEYNAIEEGLNELGSNAERLRMYASQEPNADWAVKYNEYANALDRQSEALAKQGLTPSSRRGLLDLKKKYLSVVEPIEKAHSKREELVKEQRAMKASKPSIMYDIDFSTVPLSDIINNPSISYTPVDGEDLYKKGKEAAIASSSRVMDVVPALKDQYWKIRQGYGAEAANEFLLNQESIPELKQAIERIVSQSGVSKNNLSRAIDYTISGMMTGLSYDEKYQANRGYEDKLEKERLQLQKDQFEWTKEQKEEETRGIKLPNGNRLKVIGAGRAIELNENDGTYKIVTASSNAGEPITLEKAAKTTNTPVVVANTSGVWRAGEVGNDVEKTLLGMTRSNVVSGWGNYTLDKLYDKGNIIEDVSNIPQEAAQRLMEEIKSKDIDMDKYYIVQVKAEKSRAKGDYDYVLMPKNLIELEKFVGGYE